MKYAYNQLSPQIRQTKLNQETAKLEQLRQRAQNRNTRLGTYTKYIGIKNPNLFKSILPSQTFKTEAKIKGLLESIKFNANLKQFSKNLNKLAAQQALYTKLIEERTKATELQ